MKAKLYSPQMQKRNPCSKELSWNQKIIQLEVDTHEIVLRFISVQFPVIEMVFQLI